MHVGHVVGLVQDMVALFRVARSGEILVNKMRPSTDSFDTFLRPDLLSDRLKNLPEDRRQPKPHERKKQTCNKLHEQSSEKHKGRCTIVLQECFWYLVFMITIHLWLLLTNSVFLQTIHWVYMRS